MIDGREDEQADHGEHEVGEQHLHDGDHHHRDGADRHRQRRDRAPGGLDVGVGVGEQLAGRVALVPLHGQAEVLAGDRAAVVRLHAVLHDAGAQAAGDDADRPQDGHAEEQRRPRRAAARQPISPSRNAGRTTWSVAQPSTHASATVRAPNRTLPIVERAKIPFSRLIATHRTANPSRVVAPVAHVSPPSSRTAGNRSGWPRYSPAPTGQESRRHPSRPSRPRLCSAPWSASPRSEPRSRVASGEALSDTALRRGARRAHAVRRLGRQGPGLPPARPREQPGRRARDRHPGPVRADRQGDGPAQEAAVREARGAAARPASSRSSRCRRSTRRSTPSSSSCTTRTSGAPSRAGGDATCPRSRSTPCGRRSRPRAPRWSDPRACRWWCDGPTPARRRP